jgi:hypothetical protein
MVLLVISRILNGDFLMPSFPTNKSLSNSGNVKLPEESRSNVKRSFTHTFVKPCVEIKSFNPIEKSLTVKASTRALCSSNNLSLFNGLPFGIKRLILSKIDLTKEWSVFDSYQFEIQLSTKQFV